MTARASHIRANGSSGVRWRDVARRVRSELGSIQRLCGWSGLASFLAQAVPVLPEIVRTRTLGPADARMSGRVLAFEPLGVRILVDSPPGDPGPFGLARELYGRMPYFAAPGFMVGKADVVVDLGANIGLFSVLAALLGASVVAIEAQPSFVERARGAMVLNGCDDRVTVECATIAAGSGILASFLKADIEGSEFELFADDADWAARTRRIAMEVHPRYGSLRALAARLGDLGFDVRFMGHDHRWAVPAELPGYLFGEARSPV